MCVVTGANRGIGKHTAAALSALGATVIMVCRDARRGHLARAEVMLRTRGDVRLQVADLASQRQVHALADRLTREHPEIHVLIHNAAALPPVRQVTPDGFETQMAVNHLAPFTLTHRLMAALESAAPARVISVTSTAAHRGHINLADLHARRTYAPQAVYAQTKLANLLFCDEMARRVDPALVTFNCVHPGINATGLLCDWQGRPRWRRFLAARSYPGPSYGASSVVLAATSTELANVSGRFFVEDAQVDSPAGVRTPERASQLYDASAALTGLRLAV